MRSVPPTDWSTLPRGIGLVLQVASPGERQHLCHLAQSDHAENGASAHEQQRVHTCSEKHQNGYNS